MGTASSFTIHVVSQARSAELNPLLQNQRYRLEKPCLLTPREMIGGSQWMYPCLEESFVRINVADTRHESLIQQQCLD